MPWNQAILQKHWSGPLEPFWILAWFHIVWLRYENMLMSMNSFHNIQTQFYHFHFHPDWFLTSSWQSVIGTLNCVPIGMWRPKCSFILSMSFLWGSTIEERDTKSVRILNFILERRRNWILTLETCGRSWQCQEKVFLSGTMTGVVQSGSWGPSVLQPGIQARWRWRGGRGCPSSGAGWRRPGAGNKWTA